MYRSEGSTIRVMPDVHPGKVGTIGLIYKRSEVAEFVDVSVIPEIEQYAILKQSFVILFIGVFASYKSRQEMIKFRGETDERIQELYI